MAPTTGLPEYSRPPVVEVFVAVAFDPLENLGAPHLGLLWDRHYRSALPIVTEQPPISPRIEQFGARSGRPQVQLLLEEKPPSPRYWFSNEVGTDLLQIQRDWLARNWRKRDKDPNYPRYPAVRENFLQDLSLLSEFVEQEGVGTVKPTQCEITYINHLTQPHGSLGEAINIWSDQTTEGFLPPLGEATVSAAYLITNEQGDSVGRLHVSAKPAWRKDDDSEIVVLSVTARGVPGGDSVDDICAFVDLGHEWVVRGFTDVTSEAMHARWERQR